MRREGIRSVRVQGRELRSRRERDRTAHTALQLPDESIYLLQARADSSHLRLPEICPAPKLSGSAPRTHTVVMRQFHTLAALPLLLATPLAGQQPSLGYYR